MRRSLITLPGAHDIGNWIDTIHETVRVGSLREFKISKIDSRLGRKTPGRHESKQPDFRSVTGGWSFGGSRLQRIANPSDLSRPRHKEDSHVRWVCPAAIFWQTSTKMAASSVQLKYF